jgi:hypothetical protein
LRILRIVASHTSIDQDAGDPTKPRLQFLRWIGQQGLIQPRLPKGR